MNRKKIFFILIGIVIIIVAFFIFNNIASKSSLSPRLVLSKEEWDFGQVIANTKSTHIFILTNEGGRILYIDRVRASCGCIKTSLSTDKIPSGKSAELAATFDSRGYEGTVNKAIYIKTNEEKDPEKKIIVIASVEHLTKPKIKVSKNTWELELISEGDISTFKGEIENIGDADLIIDNMVNFDNIKCNVTTPLTIKPKEKKDLILNYDSTGHKLGEVKEAVRFNCNDPKNKTQSILISGYIKEREISGIGISPEEITLNYDFTSEEDAAGKYILKNLGDRELNIVSISSSADYISPLYSNLKLKPKTEEELAVTILKDKTREVVGKEEATEYIYLTIALPVKINK